MTPSDRDCHYGWVALLYGVVSLTLRLVNVWHPHTVTAHSVASLLPNALLQCGMLLVQCCHSASNCTVFITLD